MPRKKSKKIGGNRRQLRFDSVVVAGVSSLPKGVFLLLTTSAKSPTAAAQRKAQNAGIPGEVTVLQQHPINKTTGKAIFKEMLSSLKKFPYGDADCLVKAPASAISKKYLQLSSNDPDQIELRKTMYERDVSEQLQLLDENKARVEALKTTEGEMQSSIAELNEQKQSLIGGIEELRRERKRLAAKVDRVRDAVSELESAIYDLEDLGEIEFVGSDEGESSWGQAVLIERISSLVEAVKSERSE